MSQVLAGGRGKGVWTDENGKGIAFKGGVHLTKDPKQASE